jgi:hypothetical protein
MNGVSDSPGVVCRIRGRRILGILDSEPTARAELPENQVVLLLHLGGEFEDNLDCLLIRLDGKDEGAQVNMQPDEPQIGLGRRLYYSFLSLS